MYSTIKRIVKALIPGKVLYKVEPILRKALYQFYKGDRFQCNICNREIRQFILSADGDQLCPSCGSLSRTRRLWDILSSGFLRNNIKILDFSPSRSLYRVLKKNRYIHYDSTDISGDFLSDFHYDITAIDSNKDEYDIIICYHVLEHVENDIRAMAELYRVTGKGGHCIIQSPFREGEIYEDLSVKTDKERKKHFGQADHVRIYSVGGLTERLTSCGFQVSVKRYAELPGNRSGFKTREEVLICTK